MGALSYFLEREGLLTAGISLVRENTLSMQPPRALWVPFPLGRPLGKPGDAAFQLDVIKAALGLLERSHGPVLENYPRDAPPFEADGPAACPVFFAEDAGDAGDAGEKGTWRARLSREVSLLQPWYELSLRRRGGRTLVGIATQTPARNIEALADYLDGGERPADIVWLKRAMEDIKAYYIEAMTAQPGDYDAAAIQAQFWRETDFGAAVLALYHQFQNSGDQQLKLIARILAPRQAVATATGLRETKQHDRTSMIKVQPVNSSFVADITGVDVAALSDREFAQVYAAWLQYGVLRLRNQQLDEDQLQAFSARFGPLEEIPFGRMSEADKARVKNRYVTQLSNILVDGKPIGGLGNAEASWHSDMTYVDNPPPASVLLGVEVPPAGGDTYFADQYAAYEVLPDELRVRIADLSIKHDAAHTSIGKLRPGYEPFEDPRDAPGSVHPMVRTHEETGRRALYLGRREWAYVAGLTLEASEQLLDEIWAYAALPANVWRQKWQPYDLIIWDNRRVLHRRDNFDPQSRRLMKRCQVLART